MRAFRHNESFTRHPYLRRLCAGARAVALVMLPMQDPAGVVHEVYMVGLGAGSPCSASTTIYWPRPDVGPERTGLWRGSYGGYMTALGLARNSDICKAGVDLHGVHDWYHWNIAVRNGAPLYAPDFPPAALAAALAASPINSVACWRSPVLLVHGDDDHNVAFSESVRLAEALRRQGVPYSELVLPDEIHEFQRYASWLRVYATAADFFDQNLGRPVPHGPGSRRSAGRISSGALRRSGSSLWR